MENLADDPGFIDRIVHEVKSQGLFDQFRKECLADVDTKPAYQNLRQRVETSVSKFLAQQKWTDNIRHKNQLREKLRKHIIDSGFLETGVDRIVDQVVNPKISTVFHPKVEEIVYNYLGIEKPKAVINGAGGNSSLDVQTDFLPEDLEAVSPDSDKKSSSTSSEPPNLVESNPVEELNESKENVDDFESPAFEPLEVRPPSQALKQESNDSHASVISGLTSQDSVESEHLQNKEPSGNEESYSVIESRVKHDGKGVNGCMGDDGSSRSSNNGLSSPVPIAQSPEIAQNDSQLSQVSSNSRLSIITSSEGMQQQQPQLANPGLDITEEAQMPKFNENSNEDGEILDSNDDQTIAEVGLEPRKSNFDLHKETYEFRGTERVNCFIDTASGKVMRSEHDRSPDNDTTEQNQHSSPTSANYEENSSHSERSLRICEDSTMEQHKVHDTSSQMETCDSAKTPLNDEHSTQSAPDADKLENSPPAVVTLTSIQHQHMDVAASATEKKSDRNRRDRDHDGGDRDRKHSSSHRHHSSSSSSSRDKKSHSSSTKHHRSSGGSSSSNSSNRRDKKSENGKRSSDRKREDDDHYSSHEKPAKKRRSTDRDSNDGADGGKAPRSGSNAAAESTRTASSGGTNGSSSKNSREMEKRYDDSQSDQVNLNDSLESSFEGFDEEHVSKESKILKNNMRAKVEPLKKAKKRKSDGQTDRKATIPVNMDVFAFSFEKPAKLGKNGEIIENIVSSDGADSQKHDEDVVLREELPSQPSSDSIDHLEEGIILLEPTEIEKVTIGSHEVTSSTDELTLPAETIHKPRFPETDPASLVTLVTQPVVVDQMLTNGDNMDLELLIGEKQLIGDESSMVTIQQGLDIVKNKVRKPKIASNFNEARKLMKVRKQIEREEKKKREQALVIAKKLITENGIDDGEDQGIELEFVCDENNKSSGPIISSPVRPKSKLNSSYDEMELLYLPEECEVYPPNNKLLDALRQKTFGTTLPSDFSVQYLNIKLFCLESSKSIKPKRILDEEADEVLEVEIKSTGECSIALGSSSSTQEDEKMGTEAARQLKMRSTSIDSDFETETETIVRLMKDDDDVPKSGSTDRINAQATHSKEQVSASRFGKAKRIGLPKPKSTPISNSSTAILTVDIAEVNPEMTSVDKQSPTTATEMPNNNNGALKAIKRYSTDELYKPRALNGLRARTRTRTSEVGGI